MEVGKLTGYTSMANFRRECCPFRAERGRDRVNGVARRRASRPPAAPASGQAGPVPSNRRGGDRIALDDSGNEDERAEKSGKVIEHERAESHRVVPFNQHWWVVHCE
jgi:hypothetical protein